MNLMQKYCNLLASERQKKRYREKEAVRHTEIIQESPPPAFGTDAFDHELRVHSFETVRQHYMWNGHVLHTCGAQAFRTCEMYMPVLMVMVRTGTKTILLHS